MILFKASLSTHRQVPYDPLQSILLTSIKGTLSLALKHAHITLFTAGGQEYDKAADLYPSRPASAYQTQGLSIPVPAFDFLFQVLEKCFKRKNNSIRLL